MRTSGTDPVGRHGPPPERGRRGAGPARDRKVGHPPAGAAGARRGVPDAAQGPGEGGGTGPDGRGPASTRAKSRRAQTHRTSRVSGGGARRGTACGATTPAPPRHRHSRQRQAGVAEGRRPLLTPDEANLTRKRPRTDWRWKVGPARSKRQTDSVFP